MSVQELEAEITRLPAADLKKLADWFHAFQSQALDRQIKADLDRPNKAPDHPPGLSIKTFNLGSKGPLPNRSEIAEEMFDRQ
jgi:hypothetical protein